MRIDVETIVGVLQSFSSYSVCLKPFFCSRFSGLVRFVAVAITSTCASEDFIHILPFDRDYNAKLYGAEITNDEGVEEAFELVVEGSEVVSPKFYALTNYQTQCQEVHKGH